MNAMNRLTHWLYLQCPLKNISVCLLLCLLAGQTQRATAQNQNPPADSTKAFTAALDEAIKRFQPKLPKASPQAAAFDQISNTPVNLYAGKPQISIPLTTLEGRHIALPLTLQYDASGIRVEQEATEVGLGWSLSMGGGMITRLIRGRDDFDGLLRLGNADQQTLNAIRANSFTISPATSTVKWQYDSYGTPYPSGPQDIFVQLSLFCQTSTTDNVYLSAFRMLPGSTAPEIGKPVLDGESDIFNFQAGGYNGKFLVEPQGTGYRVTTLGQSPVKIELLPPPGSQQPDLTGESGFKIITPDGVKYWFEVTEKAKARAGTAASGKLVRVDADVSDPIYAAAAPDWDLGNIDAATPQINAWYLTRIEAPDDPTDAITLSYTVDTGYSAIALPHRIQNLTVGQAKWRLTDTRQKLVNLTSIQSVKGSLTFGRSARLDMRGTMATRVDQIQLKDQFNELIQTYEFSYSYFDSGSQAEEYVKKRLRLDSFLVGGSDGEITLPPHSFSYSENASGVVLPNKNAYSQDYWGFFNNETFNDGAINAATGNFNANTALDGTLIPATIPTTATTWGFTNPARRSPNLTYAQLGTLQAIRYPTGGRQTFEYELHDFNNYSEDLLPNSILVNNNTAQNPTMRQGIGLRLRQSKVYETDTLALWNQYAYRTTDNSVYSSGKLMFDLKFSQIINDGTGNPHQLFTSTPIYENNNSAGGNPIGYDRVTQTALIANPQNPNSPIANGKTEFTFLNSVEVRKDRFCFQTPETALNCSSSQPQTIPGPCAGYSLDQQGAINYSSQIVIENTRVPNYVRIDNGNLLTKTVYGANGLKRFEETRYYVTPDPAERRRIKNLTVVGRSLTDPYPALFTYYTDTQWIRLSGMLTTQYGSDGVSALSQPQSYTYHPVNQLMCAMQQTASNGDVLLTRTTYPNDLTATNSAAQALVGQNKLGEVMEQKGENTTRQTQIWRVVNTYSQTNPGQWLPNAVRIYRNGQDPGADDLQLTYDTQANVVQQTARGGFATTYLWGYNYNYPIAEIAGQTRAGVQSVANSLGYTLDGIATATNPATALETLRTNAALRPGLMSYMLYRPLIGPSRQVTPNGLITQLNYDVLNRLSSIFDKDNFELQRFDYHHAGQPISGFLPLQLPSTLNYVLSRTARTAQTALATLPFDATQTLTTVSYSDGLGRPRQQLLWKGQPGQTGDLITAHTIYNGYGQANQSLLPTSSSANTGAYQTSVLAQAQTFYGDTHPFAQTVFENNPLNRPSNTFGPGSAWRTANKSIQHTYEIGGDEVCSFSVTATGFVLNGKYPGASLSKKLTLSERGLYTLSFTDKQGRVVATAQQTIANNFNSYLTTGYVYDDLGQLRYVVPPTAYAQLTVPGPVDDNGALFEEILFGYQYDTRGRLIQKHIPGTGLTQLVYDNKDRLVMSQDAQDADEGRWRFTRYDALGRVMQTGRMLLNESAATLRTDFSGVSGETYPATVDPAAGNVLTQQDYDSYTGAAFSFSTTGALGTRWDDVTGLITRNRTRNLETQEWYESNVWYDNKGRVIQAQSHNHLGGTDRADTDYRFNGEVNQTVLRHQKGAGGSTTTIATSYTHDHTGRPMQVSHAIDGATPTVLATYAYDAIGRTQRKTLSGGGSNAGVGSVQNGLWTQGITWQGGTQPGPMSSVSINAGHTVTIPASTTVQAGTLYDAARLVFELGSTLRLNGGSGTGGSTGLLPQPIDYTWHIRGGLRGMNLNSNSVPDLTGGKGFAMKLDYETADYYDGNIGAQTWINGSQPSQSRSYTYAYDGADRLTAANYDGGTHTVNNISYDANGNIQSMNRTGADQLAYGYQANSNKLLSVSDATSNTVGFSDGNTTGNDYEYYPDGSLKKDLNRGITDIKYNLLKLPRQLTFSSGKVVSYQYDASGRKLKMSVTGTGSETRDYVGPFQYLNNALFEVTHEEGRYSPSSGYESFHRDHLGNVRVVFGSAGITQYTDYDPWGLPLWGGLSGGNSTNRMQFNGNESVAELGAGLYDFGARLQDATIGRMHTVDGATELLNRESAYSFVGNNPLSFIDMAGSFKLDPYFAKQYPTLARIIAHYIPQVRNNPAIIQALSKQFGLKESQVMAGLEFGKGPWITPTRPGAPDESIWDSNNPVFGTDSRAGIGVGAYPEYSNNLFISNKALLQLENIVKNKDVTHLGEKMFEVAGKILHEYAHYLNFKYNPSAAVLESQAEQGALFEKNAFGTQFSYRSSQSLGWDYELSNRYYGSNHSSSQMIGLSLSPRQYFNTWVFSTFPQGQAGDPAKPKKKNYAKSPGSDL